MLLFCLDAVFYDVIDKIYELFYSFFINKRSNFGAAKTVYVKDTIMNSNLHDFMPILLQIAFCAIFVFATVFASRALGPKHKSSRKEANFECGLDPIGNARSPFPVKYFLVAILFVLFDIEIVFMYPWAVNFKTIGWDGLFKMGGFMILLIIGYLYIVKRKALEWEK